MNAIEGYVYLFANISEHFLIFDRIESVFAGLKITAPFSTTTTSTAITTTTTSSTVDSSVDIAAKPLISASSEYDGALYDHVSDGLAWNRNLSCSERGSAGAYYRTSLDGPKLSLNLTLPLYDEAEITESFLLGSPPPVEYSPGYSTHDGREFPIFDCDPVDDFEHNSDDFDDIFGNRQAVKESLDFLADRVAKNRRLNEYCLIRLIGFGTFGVVVQALSLQNGRRVAIKLMRKSQIHPSRRCSDPHSGQESILEISLLKYAPEHPNIIRYIESWDDEECWYLVCELGGFAWTAEPLDPMTGMPAVLSQLYGTDNASSPPAYLSTGKQKQCRVTLSTGRLGIPSQQLVVPERCNDYSLAGFLKSCGGFNSDDIHSTATTKNRKPILHEDIRRVLFEQLASAVCALHESGIVHKDIKDENVLVDADLRVRLIDFGHASFFRSPGLNGSNNGNCKQFIAPFKSYGTMIFSPPEVRSGLTFYGPEADIYALGLMLYEMSFGDLPVGFDKVRYCRNAECPFDLSETAGFSCDKLRKLLRLMLCPDPRNRPSIQQVLEDPWLLK